MIAVADTSRALVNQQQPISGGRVWINTMQVARGWGRAVHRAHRDRTIGLPGVRVARYFMLQAIVCKHYGLSWADARSLRLFEVKALVDHLNSEARRQEGRRQ